VLLRTLGTVDLRESASEPQILGLGKPLALLIYLSAAPARTATRSLLISLLWSDLEHDAAKHALRQTIWYIRRRVGRELLVTTGDTLQLIPDVSVDRDALLAASAAGRHADVVSLYAGPFVPNFATPGGSGFEDWCALERRRLLQVFRHAAEATIADQLSKGQARAAIDLARRLRDQDPYDEGGWRLLLEACASANDALAARAEGEALAQLAEREELQLEPATRALLRVARAIPGDRNGATDSSPAPLQAGTLVGRELIFSQLLGAWDVVRNGERRHIHITGRAGLGKSRLLRDLEARLRAMRAKVAVVSGTYGARDVAYALAGELAAALARLPGRQAVAPATAATLVELNPSLSTWFDTAPRASSREDLLRARTQAMRELALAVAYEHPIAILIDDLHWVDEPSLALLGALADGLGEAHVLLVTTGRTEARQAAVASHAETRHVTLEPLTAPQIEELVLSIAALPTEGWGSQFAGELWRTSRGSPLLALETLQLLEERGVLQRVDGTWRSGQPEALLEELRAGDALRGRLEDLERGDRWLLTLLAAAGAPLEEATLLEAADRPAAEVRARLRWLESRGVIVPLDDTWRVAHDEIGDEVLRIANVDGIARAAARLGQAMLARAVGGERQVRRAAQLLRAAGDDASRGEVFRRFARQRFAMGDRRPMEALAVELFGPTVREAEVRAVVRAAPLSWRLGLVSPMRAGLAALGTALLLAVGAFAMTREPTAPLPDAVLGLAIVDSTGHVTFRQVEIREEGWSPLEPLETKPWDVIPPFDIETRSGFEVVKRPGRDEILSTQAISDSGTIDMFLHDRRGGVRRVASAPGDDGVAQFSPTGNRIVFNTARWDSLSHYDLAMYHFDGDSVQRLTEGWATDDWPVWNPSGTRIAFSREHWGEKPVEICLRPTDRDTLECRGMTGADELYVAGWLDEDRLLVIVGERFRRGLFVLQWSTGEWASLRDGPSHWFRISPDARWGYCECQATTSGETKPMIFPVRSAAYARPLRLTDLPPGSFVRPFWIASNASTNAEAQHLAVDGPSAAPSGVPLVLTAALTDALGHALLYRGSLRWSLDDSAAGRIDSLSGTLVMSGQRPRVRVYARSGAIARDSIDIAVAPPAMSESFTEEWSDTTLTSWFPFGAPAPSVVETREGIRAMRNNGEGSFESGVLSRRVFDGSRGLALEARVSGGVTQLQWQAMRLAIVSHADTALFVRGRGRNVSPTYSGDALLCSFGSGVEGRRRGRTRVVSVMGSAQSLTVSPPDTTILAGRWYTVRLQVLPDMRCGVAIDGVPLAIIGGQGGRTRTNRVMLSGNTYKTDMLAGRLRVWEGIPSDIDWTRAPHVIP